MTAHRRRRLPVLRPIVAVACLLAALAVTPPAATAQATTPGGAGGPSLQLTSQPSSVGPEDDFPVFLGVSNAPAGSRIVVDIYDPVTSPDQIGQDPHDSAATFEPFAFTGDTAGFAIELYGKGDDRPASNWAHEIDGPGVYPVRIHLWDADDAVVATLVTYLVRRPGPGESVHQAHVAVVAKVHQAPPTDATVRASDSGLPSDYVDRLGTLVAALGRRRDLPATFSVTPDTASRLAAAGDRASRKVATALRADLNQPHRELLDAPYVDLDPASLVDAGLASELSRQRDLGNQALADLLEPPLDGTWAIDHPVDEATLASLAGRGISRALLPQSAFSGRPPLAPLHLAAGDAEVRALVEDPSLSPNTAADDPVLAANRLLARLSATAVLGSRDPAVVLTLDPETTDTAQLPILLDALTLGSPYFTATTVDGLFELPADPRSPVLAAPSGRSLGTYPGVSVQVHQSLESYDSMVTGRPALVNRYGRPLAIAAADDLPVADREADLLGVEAQLRRRFSAIATPPRDKVTLGAREATFPITITSKLNYPVRVVIELDATDRLEFPHDRIAKELQNGRTVADIRVRTRASGDTPVRITVRSPDGRVILAESQYTIRSTAVSGVGILLTIGAAGFLAVWWARSWWQSRKAPRARPPRRGRRAEPAEV